MGDAVAEYKLLLEQFLYGELTVEEFQRTYLTRFKNEKYLGELLYELLEDLFGDVDSFTTDPQLLAANPNFYLDEAGLRERVQNTVNRISASKR